MSFLIFEFQFLWRKLMKTKLLITLLLTLGLLAACAERNPHPMDMTQAVQNAESKADHEALAQHYEEAAKEMQLKVDEHKKLLSQYESKSYLYGRQAQSFKNHCQWLLNSYEKAVEENLSMAKMHRQM
jgi:ABC-type Fe3+-citrate transport system substrate-binding protein